MLRKTALLIIMLMLIVPVWGQEDVAPPDYRVQILGTELTDDGENIIVTFGVYNTGGDAEDTAIVQLRDISSSEEIARTRVRPLGGGGDSEAELSLSFGVREFEPGSRHTLEVMVGIGDIEPEDADTILNNSASITVEIPDYDPSSAPAGSTSSLAAGDVLVIPLLEVELDTTDPAQMAILSGIIISIVVMLVLSIIIVRLLFQSTPTFGNWQPPYATMPPLDPNSTYGRRQLWQQHAQNNVVPMPCRRGSYHARKILMGMDGHYLSGWRVAAIRMTQYDMYGRVSRSQILASTRMIGSLNKVIRRASRLDEDRLRKRVRPVGKDMARTFWKKVKRRSPMLPIAFDIRMEGKHGDVRIMFDLYECQDGQPVQLDYWEPEMMVVGKRINESYTFTVFGQRNGEPLSEFRSRLERDIESVLADFLRTAVTTTTATPEEEPPVTDTMAGEAVQTDTTNAGSPMVKE